MENIFRSEAKIERLVLSNVQNISKKSNLTLTKSPKFEQPKNETKISTLFCQIQKFDGNHPKKFSTLPRNLKISNEKFDKIRKRPNIVLKIDPKNSGHFEKLSESSERIKEHIEEKSKSFHEDYDDFQESYEKLQEKSEISLENKENSAVCHENQENSQKLSQKSPETLEKTKILDNFDKMWERRRNNFAKEIASFRKQSLALKQRAEAHFHEYSRMYKLDDSFPDSTVYL